MSYICSGIVERVTHIVRNPLFTVQDTILSTSWSDMSCGTWYLLCNKIAGCLRYPCCVIRHILSQMP